MNLSSVQPAASNTGIVLQLLNQSMADTHTHTHTRHARARIHGKHWGLKSPGKGREGTRRAATRGCGAFSGGGEDSHRGLDQSPRPGRRRQLRLSEMFDFPLLTASWKCVVTWTGSCSTVIPRPHSVYRLLT